jgi:polyphosphate kinase 2 (PPK2 family)
MPGLLKRKPFYTELRKLQLELCRLQEWVQLSRKRGVVLLEGRFAGDKDYILRTLGQRADPRIFRRAEAQGKEKVGETASHMQPFARYFPAAGEIAMLAESWYGAATADYVLGYCDHEQHLQFLKNCPLAEQLLVDADVRLVKLWIEIGPEEEERRLGEWLADPLRRWQVTARELELHRRWYDYSRARDVVFEHTDTDHAPWHIVHMDDLRSGTLNAISHILAQFPYEPVERAALKLPARSEARAYDDYRSIADRRVVPDLY